MPKTLTPPLKEPPELSEWELLVELELPQVLEPLVPLEELSECPMEVLWETLWEEPEEIPWVVPTVSPTVCPTVCPTDCP